MERMCAFFEFLKKRNMTTINKERTKRRGNALLETYIRENKNTLPPFQIFVNDFFDITDHSKNNKTIVKEVILVLRDIYSEFEKRPEVSILYKVKI
jgi:hypothetical protein